MKTNNMPNALPIKTVIRNALFTMHYARETRQPGLFSEAAQVFRVWYPQRHHKGLILNRFSY